MYKTRRLVIKIFSSIQRIEEIKVKVKNLVNLQIDFKQEAEKTQDKLRQNCRDLEKIQKELLQDIVVLLKDNKFLGNKIFVFKKKEWVSYSVKEYEKIKKMALKVDIRMKDIKDLQPK